MNFLRIILLTLTTLIYAFTGVLNAEVDEDCLCNLKEQNVSVFGNVYVDTCKGDTECSIFNEPFYYDSVDFVDFKNYGLADKDTGALDIDLINSSAAEFIKNYNIVDSAVKITFISREVFLDYNFYIIKFLRKSSEKYIDSILENTFYPIMTHYSNVPTIVSVGQNSNGYTVNKYNDRLSIESIKIINNIRILDLTGKLNFSQSNINSYSYLYALELLNSGIYFMIVNDEHLFKFIK